MAVALLMALLGQSAAWAHPHPVPGPAHPAGRPTRGTQVQVTPTLPPPQSTWTTGSVPNCVPGQLVRRVDGTPRPMISFTFDDGPDPRWSPIIMDEFASRGLTATFMVVGVQLQAYPDVAREEVARGFAIGNHAISHRYSSSLIAAEVPQMNDMIWQTLHVRTPYFRAPGIPISSTIDAALVQSGQCYLHTDVVLGDHLMPRLSSGELCARFAGNLHSGQVVLLHDGGDHSQTAYAVGCMLDVALSRGYSVVSMMDLLAAGTVYSVPPYGSARHGGRSFE